MRSSSYEIICSYMPERIKAAMQKVDPSLAAGANEIRVRAGRPIVLVYSDKLRFLNNGYLSDTCKSDNCMTVTANEIDFIVKSLCRFSIHSCEKELSQGFFTLDNGIRVGLAGTMSTSNDGTLKYISSLNFRISREVIGCADSIFSTVFAGGLKSVLICGGVNSGKTTLLRDLCRICGERNKTVLIDERSEISAPVCGVPSYQIGINTDVLEGYERSDGIMSAVRTLSPQIIFCDEISSNKDAEAILHGFGSGVKFAASVHADSLDSIGNRPMLSELISAGVFDYAVQLEGESFPGKIKEIRRMNRNG